MPQNSYGGWRRLGRESCFSGGKEGNATRDPWKRASPPLSLPELEVFLAASHPGSTGGPAIIAAYRRGTRFYRPGSL